MHNANIMNNYVYLFVECGAVQSLKFKLLLTFETEYTNFMYLFLCIEAFVRSE